MWSEVEEVGLKSKSESNEVFLAVPNGNAKFRRAKCTSDLFSLLRRNLLGCCWHKDSAVPKTQPTQSILFTPKNHCVPIFFEEVVGDEISRHLFFPRFFEYVLDGNC